MSAKRRILYSFRDVVALRTCVYLREQVSLQRVRRALDALQDLGETGHLSEYRLVAQGRSVVLIKAHDDGVDLVDYPGHQVMVVMGEVLRPFEVRNLVIPDLYHPRAFIRVDPQIRGGHPVVGETRVPYELVAGLVRDGVPHEEVGKYYPAVSAAAARDAEDFAAYVDHYEPRRTDAA